MFRIGFKLESDLPERKLARMRRDLNRKTMRRIVKVYWPRHFEQRSETAPGGAYGYVPRSRIYLEQKLRKVGHQIPNVFTGRTMRHVLTNAKITATQHKATLRSGLPFLTSGRTHGDKSNDPGKSQRAAQRVKEIEAFTPQEEQELAEWYGKSFIRMQRLPQYRRKRKRKG